MCDVRCASYPTISPSLLIPFFRLETGYISEIVVEAAMRSDRNIWIDGSLRDTHWHELWFGKIRKLFPQYRIAIVYVSVSDVEIPIAR